MSEFIWVLGLILLIITYLLLVPIWIITNLGRPKYRNRLWSPNRTYKIIEYSDNNPVVKFADGRRAIIFTERDRWELSEMKVT